MADQQEARLGQQIGEYRLVHKLGGGGFGTVYLAEHVHEHTQAAVKVLSIPLTKPEDFKDFLSEVRTVLLRHPHIVPLLDFGISRNNLPFLVMEYVPEGTLRDRHLKGERIPLSTIVSYVDQLAPALQYTHDHRVIHRDVKPANILVRADGTLLMSDFGIAKLLEQSMLISQQTSVGTPAYMAPEQYRGYPCFASDQYALAVVVYEWICGVRPFQGPPVGLAVQHMNTPPPSLRNHLPELSEAVESVIFKALAKPPEDRFERIENFADALHKAVQPQPSTIVLSPPVETSNTPPAAAYIEPTADVPPFIRNSTEVLHSSPQDLPRNTVPPFPQKRRPDKRSLFLIGGVLGLLLSLVILVITIRPIIRPPSAPTPKTYGPSATPTHPDQTGQKWPFPMSDGMQSSPTVVNGVLYTGSWDDGKVYAINASTGQKIWAFTTGVRVFSSPTVQGGTLYVGCWDDGKVYAIDASTGQEKWAFTTGGRLFSSPTVINGVLYKLGRYEEALAAYKYVQRSRKVCRRLDDLLHD